MPKGLSFAISADDAVMEAILPLIEPYGRVTKRRPDQFCDENDIVFFSPENRCAHHFRHVVEHCLPEEMRAWAVPARDWIALDRAMLSELSSEALRNSPLGEDIESFLRETSERLQKTLAHGRQRWG